MSNSLRMTCPQLRGFMQKALGTIREKEASEVLLDAANTLAAQPQALQLRYLQTLTEVANERSSTIVFPLPMDMIDSFLKRDK